jgi:hypothetical protein
MTSSKNFNWLKRHVEETKKNILCYPHKSILYGSVAPGEGAFMQHSMPKSKNKNCNPQIAYLHVTINFIDC